jgi:hypothetical protein
MEISDKDILDTRIGETSIKDMTALHFLGWVASKMNGVPAYSAANQELSLAVSAPPLGRLFPDNEKVRLVRKLLSIGVTI